jgi:hypothetical protein
MKAAVPAAVLAAAGAGLLIIGILLAVFANVQTMPSYLAGWLFLAAIPFGALPLVMALDLMAPGPAGFAWTYPLVAILRRQLLLAPLAALLAIPLLFRVHALYLHAPLPHTPFGRAWMTIAFYIPRVIVYLGLWSLLALLFARPRPGMPRAVAALGLMLHLIIATFAATDLAMAVEPGWMSSDFPVLFMAGQCVIALSVAALRMGSAGASAREPGRVAVMQAGLGAAGLALLGLTGLWIFVQYTQYETIWSADLPAEIIWYIHRDAGGGPAVEWIGFIGGFVLPLLMLPSRRADAVRLVAALLLAVQMLDMLWLITPAFRATFTITLIDVIEMAGLAGIGFGFLLLLDIFIAPATSSLRQAPRRTAAFTPSGRTRTIR